MRVLANALVELFVIFVVIHGLITKSKETWGYFDTLMILAGFLMASVFIARAVAISIKISNK